jgi:uncharacterized membrane protein YraQ (UPF0718 family)
MISTKKNDIIDPICGMKGTIFAHGHYFCSSHCIKKYEEENKIKNEEKYCPSCATNKGTPWYKEKLFIILIATIILLFLGYFLDPEKRFFFSFVDYLKLIWWAILIGFLIGGIIDYFIPRAYIEKYLSRHRKRTIVYSIIFGFLMSACSHGILAIAIEIYKKGASTSSVIAFLLASPWANLPITFLLFGFFGIRAAFIIFSALVIALITGLIFQRLEKRGLVECDKCKFGEDKTVHENFSIINDVKKRWNNYRFTKENNIKAIKGTFFGSWALMKMVLWWLIVGMLMAAAARAFVPQGLFEQYMGPTIIGLLVTLFFATIIEVCSEGSAPLAFEIYSKSGAFGNSFTFLMAGVVSDYTEIGLIWHNIGRRAAIFLPIITIPQVLFFGFLYNLFL